MITKRIYLWNERDDRLYKFIPMLTVCRNSNYILALESQCGTSCRSAKSALGGDGSPFPADPTNIDFYFLPPLPIVSATRTING